MIPGLLLSGEKSQEGKGEPFQRELNSSFLKSVSDPQVVFPLPNC